MAESANSLARRGLISTGAFNAMQAKTRVQKSKMAKFDTREKDEADTRPDDSGPGGFKINHIDHKANQSDRAKSMPSKGARVNASQTPNKKQIDNFPAGQHKTFPKGAGVVSKGAAGSNTRMKGGRIPRSGGPYGGGGRDTQ